MIKGMTTEVVEAMKFLTIFGFESMTNKKGEKVKAEIELPSENYSENLDKIIRSTYTEVELWHTNRFRTYLTNDWLEIIVKEVN